jgi:hypothetical protein
MGLTVNKNQKNDRQIFRDMEKIAYVEKKSVNEVIYQALELYKETKKDVLSKYAEIEKSNESSVVDNTA